MLEKTLQIDSETSEATEFIAMLKTMSESEKNQIKGVMIGIKLSKENTNRVNRYKYKVKAAGGNEMEICEPLLK